MRGTNSRSVTIAIGAAILVGALIALLIGRSLSGDHSKTAQSNVAKPVAAGHLSLSSWTGWQRGRVPARVSALIPGGRVVNPAGTDVSVVFGDLPVEQVSRTFSALGLQATSGEELTAGKLKTRMYTGQLPGPGHLAVTALFVPSSAGASSAICLSDASSVGAKEDCKTVLTTTVALRNASPVRATPSAADATAMIIAINDLNIRRGRDAAELSAATTSGRQANAAAHMSADYQAIASRVSAIGFTALASAPGKSLVAQLKATAAGYDSLARAADGHSQAAYTTALGAALAADAKISQSLDALTALGYGAGKR
jgi:hypothetical protein